MQEADNLSYSASPGPAAVRERVASRLTAASVSEFSLTPNLNGNLLMPGSGPNNSYGATDQTNARVKALKIVVVGDPTVGKTTFVNRYVNGVFRVEYIETFGVDFAQRSLKWSDELTLNLQLWDIAGQDRFRAMTRVFYRDAHAAIVIADLTQDRTLEGAAVWKADIDEKCRMADGEKIPCLLIANKADLRSQRAVTQEKVEELCDRGVFVGWAEASVKNNVGVDDSIEFLIDCILERLRGLEMRQLITPTLTAPNGPGGGKVKNLPPGFPGAPRQDSSTVKLTMSTSAQRISQEKSGCCMRS